MNYALRKCIKTLTLINAAKISIFMVFGRLCCIFVVKKKTM